jgi:acyl-CoA thioesterase
LLLLLYEIIFLSLFVFLILKASGGRGLAFGKIFTRDGKLAVTTAQEGLIRVVKTPTDKV